MPGILTEIEQTLINGLRSGKDEDFDQLYQVYSPVLMGIANKMVDNYEEAKTILQRTFIYIWKNRLSYDPSKERLFAWMVKSLRLVALQADHTKDVSASLRFIIQQSGVVDKSECDNHQKWVLESVYYNGHSTADVAHKINLEEDEVRFMLKQAILKLNH